MEQIHGNMPPRSAGAEGARRCNEFSRQKWEQEKQIKIKM